MIPGANLPGAEVFVSYSSRDRGRVLRVAECLQAAGVSVWVDQNKIPGGANYGPEIVAGIKACKVLVLMCSDAALRSRNVKQEIQLAWKYQRPYLPLLLEPISFPEQVEYWLEGCQWIEVTDRPPELWLPAVAAALARCGISCPGAAGVTVPVVPPAAMNQSLARLRALARLTDEIWPVPAERAQQGTRGGVLRDLGAPQDDVQHAYRLGSRLRLVLESDHDGHLLLLDEGTSGAVFCLCPSWFAPDTRLQPGRTCLPQPGARYDAFEVSGRPGREHLLAILSAEPLGLSWMPAGLRGPARSLTLEDIDDLLARLRDLPADRWTALSTYFDVLA
jgi:TIR domain-containing protein/uncharacterized protein DUF4384